ncbi:MAG: glycosyltransferase, partial [bacterium]|nr:glycosyltransferase [bacterium]
MPPPDKAHPLPAGLSVVVPVYNSAAILPQLVARLGPVLQATGWAPELILVNDGSRDDSWAVIQNLATLHPWVRG